MAGAVNNRDSSQLAHLERAFRGMGLEIPGQEEARNLITQYLRAQAKLPISEATRKMCQALLVMDDDAPIEDVWGELVDIQAHDLQLPDVHPDHAQKLVGEFSYTVNEAEVKTLR